MRRRRAVVVLSTPLTPRNGQPFLSERAHILTLRLLCTRFEDVAVVARCRDKAVLADVEYVALNDTGARFAYQLPDFGAHDRPLLAALALMLSPRRYRALMAVAAQADLLYVEVPSLEGLLVWRIARRLQKPYIIEMRGEGVLNADYMRARAGSVGALAHRAFVAAFEVARRGAVGALFVGEGLRQRFAPPRALTAVISSVRLPPRSPRPARRYWAPARAFLFVGHLEKIKAIHVILEAVAMIAAELPPDWRLDIIGDGPERMALVAKASALGIGGHVHFHGRVAWGENLFHFYESADMLLMASLSEGNSRTLLEGMAFALPAVSTAVGEAPKHLCPEALVPPSAPAAFAAAVRLLATAPDRLSAMSKHNAEQLTDYAPEELERRRAAFFDSVLERIATDAEFPLSAT